MDSKVVYNFTANFEIESMEEDFYILKLSSIDGSLEGENYDKNTFESGFLQGLIDLENDPHLRFRLYEEENKIHTFTKENEFEYEYVKQ